MFRFPASDPPRWTGSDIRHPPPPQSYRGAFQESAIRMHPGLLPTRIANRVAVQPEKNGCWLWIGALYQTGYGAVQLDGRMRGAHRAIYELLVGPVPEGLQLDHLCRVRHCVNPTHLEPVTIRENLLRGVGLPASQVKRTHCPKGHAYDEENTYTHRGTRHCYACMIETNRRTRARRASATPRPQMDSVVPQAE